MNCVLRHKNRAWDGGGSIKSIHGGGTLNIQVGWVEGGGKFWISFFNYLLSLSDAEKTNRIEMCF